jgi:ankyrin repeat protein
VGNRVILSACVAATWTIGLAAAGDLRLIDAVRAQNVERVRTLLAERIDVNATQGDGATALHWAVHRDDGALVDTLIRAGARTNIADDTGTTPLFLACTNRNAEIVSQLLGAGANPNAALPSGETVLMTCARTGNADAVRALLARGAMVNAKESAHNQTALMWAAAQSHPQAVQALLERGADTGARSREYTQTVTSEVTQRAGRETLNYAVPRGGMTALLFAARAGDAESVRLLVAAGADVNDALPDGTSTLVVAAHSGHRQAAMALLDKGANPNADGVGYTALHAAVLRSDGELVRALLAHGADPNAPITKGTPVRRNSQDFELPRTLIGATPYALAAKFLEPEIMHALASASADTRRPMKDGATPLMLAVGMGMAAPAQDEKRGTDRRGLAILDGGIVEPESRVLETVTAALSLGGDLEEVNPSGETALHIASAQGYETVVRALAERGANLNARNLRGQTPLGALVARKARPNMIELLRKLGAGM